MANKMYYVNYTVDGGKTCSTSIKVETKADAVAMLEQKHNARVVINVFRPL